MSKTQVDQISKFSDFESQQDRFNNFAPSNAQRVYDNCSIPQIFKFNKENASQSSLNVMQF